MFALYLYFASWLRCGRKFKPPRLVLAKFAHSCLKSGEVGALGLASYLYVSVKFAQKDSTWAKFAKELGRDWRALLIGALKRRLCGFKFLKFIPRN